MNVVAADVVEVVAAAAAAAAVGGDFVGYSSSGRGLTGTEARLATAP
jgi:hypothetical protein